MLDKEQKKKNRKFIFIVVLISALLNFSFLEYNNYLIRKNNPDNININAESLVYDQTIFSVDNEFYLSPVDNYLIGKGWKRSPAVSNGDYFRRVPGYSVLYFSFVKIFGYSSGHLFIKVFQLLLFLATIPAIFFLSTQIAHRRAGILVTIVYAFIPFISSWTYFTLTESISPALTIFYFYFLFKGYRTEVPGKKLENYMLASLFFVFGVLTRPYIAIAGLPLFLFTFNDYIVRRPAYWMRNFLGIWLIAFLLVGSWTIRNYLLTKEFVPLEKAVHPQTLERMKPDFRSFFAFVKCWGEDGFVMNIYQEPLFFSALKGDTASVYVENVLNAWPSKVVNHFGRDRLFDALKHYQYSVFKMKPYVDSVRAMPEQFLPEQLAVKKEFDQLVSEYRKSFFFDYWIRTPFRYFKQMVANSNTGNIYAFQEDHRNKILLNLFRYLLLIIHLLIYLSLFINFFVMKGFANRLAFVYVPLLFIFFFVVIHREVEQRYMLPILPMLIVGMASSANWFLTLVFPKRILA